MASISTSRTDLLRHSLPPERRVRREPTLKRAFSLRSSRPRRDPIDDAFQQDSSSVAEVLEKIHIKFTACTFTYTLDQLEILPGSARESSVLTSAVAKLGYKRPEEISKHEYRTCFFLPNDGQEIVQAYIKQTFTDVPMIFENCIFMKRESSLIETLMRKLKRIWNYVPFKLLYQGLEGPPLVLLENGSFRLKDVSKHVNSYVIERILERSDYFIVCGDVRIAFRENSFFL